MTQEFSGRQPVSVPGSPLLIKLRISVQEKEYIGANRLFLRARQSATRVLSILAGVLLAFSIGSVVFSYIASGGQENDLLFLLPLPLFALLTPLLQRAAVSFSARRAYAKEPEFSEPRCI